MTDENGQALQAAIDGELRLLDPEVRASPALVSRPARSIRRGGARGPDLGPGLRRVADEPETNSVGHPTGRLGAARRAGPEPMRFPP
jgi:hypothetical protein